MTGARRWLGLVLGLVLASGAAAAGQDVGSPPHPLSLEEAIRLGLGTSEQLAAARGGATSARGQEIQARAQRLPQLNASATYQRTLKSQFSGLRSGGGSADTSATPGLACGPFTPMPGLPLPERVDSLEHALQCLGNGGSTGLGGLNVGRLGFGQTNNYNIGFSFSQLLFSGGRAGAQVDVARASRGNAELNVTAQSAQALVDVTQAYYDALLGDRLLGIAQQTLAEAQRTLEDTQLGFKLGTQAEFDVLRARVAVSNQQATVVRQRSTRTLAFIHLKQLLDLPVDQALTLTTPLPDSSIALAPAVALPAAADASDTATAARVAVRQAQAAVRIQGDQLDIARSQRLPSVNLVSNYGLVAYPQGLFPSPNGFLSNWTVGLSVGLPIFDGGAIRGGVVQAQGALEQARAQLQLTREAAVFDTRSKQEQLVAAAAAWRADSEAVGQAVQAYDIAVLRYRQGLSSLIELQDARLALEEARANRAQAARDVEVARVQLAVIRDLPLSAGGLGTAGTATGAAVGATGGLQVQGVTPQGGGLPTSGAGSGTTTPSTGGAAAGTTRPPTGATPRTSNPPPPGEP